MHTGTLIILVLAGDLSCSRHSRGGGAADPEEVVEIEYRSISRFPTCRGNERIHIDRDGKVFKATNLTDCAPGEHFSTPYPAQPGRTLDTKERAGLVRAIRSSGFFNLPTHYSSPSKAATDGFIEEIEVTLGTPRHTVVMENATMPAFAQVKQRIIDAAY